MKRQPIDRYTGPTTLGVDVSRWQGEIDWTRVAQDEQQLRFAIVRTGDGKDTDSHAVRNLVHAHEAGLLVATYHYFRADRAGARQLELVHEVLRVADVPVLFVALDIEAGADDNLPGGLVPGPRAQELDANIVAAEALEFLEGVDHHLARPAVVYAGQWFHWVFSQARPELAAPFGRWPLWVPSYGSRHPRMPVDNAGVGHPWPTWAIHQFTADGQVRGIRGRVDLNRFRGDDCALRVFGNQRGCATDPLRVDFAAKRVARGTQ